MLSALLHLHVFPKAATQISIENNIPEALLKKIKNSQILVVRTSAGAERGKGTIYKSK